jgi:glutamate carboxypeptidase
LDEGTHQLLEAVADCGRLLGLDLSWRPSGGVCDGNRLAAAGLPTVDTLGPRGGELHSPREYVRLDSLVERAKLTALLLMRLAAGDVPPGAHSTRRSGNMDDPAEREYRTEHLRP